MPTSPKDTPSGPDAVLHVCLSHSWGGEEMWVLEMARHQAERGLRPSLCVRHGSALARRGAEAGLTLLEYQPPWDRLLFPLRARRFCQQHGIQLVHAHHLRGLVRTASLLPAGRIRLLLTLHALQTRRPRHPLTRRLLARLDGLHAMSPAQAQANARALGIPVERISLVPHGVDLERFRPCPDPETRAEARRQLQIEPQAVAVLLPGRLGSKNQEPLLEAIHQLGESGRRIQLLLAGEDRDLIGGAAPQHARLLQRIQALGMEARVHFLGFVEDMPRVYAASDLVVLPSDWESFGLVAAEALACGVPLAVSDRGALPWVVQDGALGSVVEGVAPGPWCQLLADYLADPAPFLERARAGVEAARRRFDALAQRDALVALYRSLCGHPATAPSPPSLVLKS